MGVVGLFVIILTAFFLCNNKKHINYRVVLSSFLLLIGISIFIFSVPIGIKIVSLLANLANVILLQGSVGAEFLFGELAKKQGFVFAIHVLTNVVFLGALFAVLYYLKIMRPLNNCLSYILAKTLRISRVESINSVYNIFLGPGESQLAFKHYLPYLTKSEMFTVMVSGCAAISGSVMGGYIAMGMSAKYIVSAVLMTVPGSIFLAKLMFPETSTISSIESKKIHDDKLPEEKASNILEAISIGAYTGLKVALSIGIMVISFVSLIAVVNVLLGWVGGLVSIEGLSLQKILGYIFAPIAYIIGIPSQDVLVAGSLIGEKIITNEFIAFLSLKECMTSLDPKTQMIVIFSLCGFSNFGTVGIFLGCIQGLVPNKIKEFASLSGKAILTALMVNILNGTIAGIMFDIEKLFK